MNHSRLVLAACVLLMALASASGCGGSSKSQAPAQPQLQQPIRPVTPQGYYPPPSGQLQPPIGNAQQPGYPIDNDDNYVPMNYNY